MRPKFPILTMFILAFSSISCSAERPAQLKEAKAQTVSAEELRAVYKESQKAFADQYVGKRLIVTGRADEITSQIIYQKGKWDIVLTGKDADINDPPWISCRVPEEFIAAFAPVKIGDQVTVEGICRRVTKSTIMLEDCKLKMPERP